jgi:hypothetical protein
VESNFVQVAEASKLRIVIYTNSHFQKVDLGTDLIAELNEHSGFVGLKDAKNNTGRLLSLADRCRPGFGIYAASSHVVIQRSLRCLQSGHVNKGCVGTSGLRCGQPDRAAKPFARGCPASYCTDAG